MLAWLLLLGLRHAAARDTPNDTHPVTRHIASCPTAGYFFQRDAAPNSLGAGHCFLCFCQDDDSALCWRRQNQRCDLKHYRHNIGKRDTRAKRSPLSLGEVFVRDATREFFNKQSPEQCKPFESSFSDGCPPADWCIGCTVCDCDANGRWDCHILSFCPDKNGKKQMKKQRPRGGPLRNRISKRQSKTSKRAPTQTTKNTGKPAKKPTRKPPIKPNARRNTPKTSASTNHKNNQVKSAQVKKYASVKKPNTKVQGKKAAPSINNKSKKPLLIKKNVTSNKPLNIQSNKDKKKENSTVEVAQKVVKQFMSTMQKMIKSFERKTNNTQQGNKVVKKRSMSKQQYLDENKERKITKFLSKSTPTANLKKRTTRKFTPIPQYAINRNRNKRQIENSTSLLGTESTSNGTVKNGGKNVSDIIYSNNLENSTQNQTLDFNKFGINGLELELGNETNYIFENDADFIIKYRKKIDGERNITTTYYDLNDFNNTQSQSIVSINKNNFTSGNSDINKATNSTVKNVVLSTDNDFSTLYPKPVFNQTELTQNLIVTDSEIKGYISTKDNFYKNTESPEKKTHNFKNKTLIKKLHDTDDMTKLNIEKAQNIKPKRFTILNKIKTLIKKIFSKQEKTKSLDHEDLYGGYNQTQKTNDIKCKLCQKLKPQHCILDQRNKNRLRHLVYQLKTEGETILKSVGIIKGLLHMLDLNDVKTQNINNSYRPNENINKLTAIVTEKYNNDNSARNLSEVQKTQIYYIKDNFNVFVRSMGKFAKILDEVIRLIMYHSKKQNYNAKLLSNNINNDSSHKKHNLGTEKDIVTNQKLEKLKKLFLNYHHLQTKFMNQIVKILSNSETGTSDEGNIEYTAKKDKYKILNKPDIIENNSKNILRNIKKLKDLAEKLNTLNRRKRSILEDSDSMEYLLILMEYLLKRHAPRYHPPASDGLDLLIEAIKSAPDHKLITKKVLENTSKPTSHESLLNDSDLNNLQRENNNTTRKDQNVSKSTDHDDVVDDEDKIEEFYRNFKSVNDSNSEQTREDTSLPYHFVSSTNKPYYNTEEALNYRKNNNDIKDISNNDTNHNFSEESTSSKTIHLETSSEDPVTLYNNIEYTNVPSHHPTNKINDFVVDTKANIDWIEENFREQNPQNQVDIKPTTPKTETATRTQKTFSKNTETSSDTSPRFRQKEKNKSSSEEVMSKKQREFLNSLDYAAEKEDDNEADSKEDESF